MATKMKKTLSLALALIMVLGMLPLTAFAAENSSADQISTPYAPTVEGNDVNWTASNTDTVTDEANGVTVQKKIAGTDQENVFDITLNVTTKEQLKNLTVSPDAAVVVVLDVSSSMDEKEGGQERLAKAKSAATDFVASLAKDAGTAKRMVSVVQFGTSAQTAQGWTDVSAAEGLNAVQTAINDKVQMGFSYYDCINEGVHTHEKNYIKDDSKSDWTYNGTGEGYTCQVCAKFAWTKKDHDHCTFPGCPTPQDTKHTHPETFNGPHGSTHEDDQSTNVEAGLQLASNLLTKLTSDSAYSKIDKRYVVLLSDGAPNRIVATKNNPGYNGKSADRASTIFILGSGEDGSYDNLDFKYASPPATDVATQIRATEGNAATLYAISYANSEDGENTKWMKNKIASPKGFFDAANNEKLDLAFEKINEQIKLLAQAWTVADPMGDDVSFVEFNDGADVINEIRRLDGSTIHWDLKRDKPVHSGSTYTYSLSYRVKLNTDKVGFDEAIDHRTNGLTTLKYVVTENGVVPENPEVLQLNFNVPSVKGEIPTLNYSIEYYLQKDGQYELQSNATKNKSAPMHTEVKLDVVDEGYQNKYDAQNYKWVKSDPETVTLTKNGTVLKVYYDRVMVDIAVNHYLTTTKYDENGIKTVTKNELQPESRDEISVPKGEQYTATKLTDLQDGKYADYKFVSGDPTIQAVQGGETIKLYYSVTKDARAVGTIAVFHQLNQWNWVLENGVYTQKLTEGEPAQVGSTGDIRAHDTFETPKTTATEGYTFTEATCATSDVTLTDSTVSIQTVEGENKLYLTFTKAAPEIPAEKALIKVTHTYTKNVTTIENGVAVHDTTAHEDIVEYKPVETLDDSTWYAGETRTVTADKTQPAADSADVYAVVGDASKTIKALAAGTNEVTFHYVLNQSIGKTAAKVNFIYRTWETVTVKDAETGIESTETRIKATVTNPVDVPNLYVGQYVPVNADTQKPTGSYTLNTAESTPDYEAVPALAGGATTINLYYDNEVIEDHRAADVTVTHTYTANKTTVQGGKVVTLKDLPEGNSRDSYTGVTGEPMFGGATDVIKESYNGNNYTCSNENAVNMDAVFAAGHNPQIDLKYSRDYNDLVAAGYQVNYTYYDWQMTVQNGVAGYYDGESKVKNKMSTSTNVTGTEETPLYVGMKVTLADGVQDGYVTEGNNSSTTPTLQDGANVYNFIFVKKTPLAPATVTVKHSYVLTTISNVGVSTTADPVVEDGSATPDSSKLYPGVTVSAEAVKKDYNLKSVTVKDAAGKDVTYTADDAGKVSFSATGADTVVFNYTKTVDNSIGNSATYKIIDHYRTTDWNGTTEYSDELRTEGSSYGTEKVTYSVRRLGTEEAPLYAVDEVTSLGGTVIAQDGISYTMQLKPGENTLNFYYTKTVDTRPEVSVIVNHVYRVTDPNAPGEFVQEAVVSESMKAKAPGEYIAAKELDRTDSDKTIHYTFVESDHPDCKLIVTTVESNNVINLYYTRAYGEGDLFNVHGMKEYVGIDENQYPDTTIYLKQNGEIKYSAPVTGREFTFENVRPGVYDLGESADLSGYTYTAKYELVSHATTMALEQNESAVVVSQITVNKALDGYLRITNTYTSNPTPPPTPGTTYYGITVKYVDEAGKELSAAHTERHYEGYSYDVTDKTTLQIADYTIKSVTGDTLAGRLNGDKVITVVYAPVVVIPDEPVPEGGKPGEVILPDTEPPKNELPEELEDGAVPLDAAPKTGDTATLWTTLMAVSGFGLAALAIFKGKKKEEDSAE